MSPRKLDGGNQELADLILRNLQGVFPRAQFVVKPLDQAEFKVCWSFKAQGAPGMEVLRVYMARHWPDIDAILRNSDEKALEDRTGGSRKGMVSLPASSRSKNKLQKTCQACGSECRRAARACTECGALFPVCRRCNALLEVGEKYCSKCGRILALDAAVLTPDSFPGPLKELYYTISAIADEPHARKFLEGLNAQLPPEVTVRTFIDLCVKAGMTPERVPMWCRVIDAAQLDRALRRLDGSFPASLRELYSVVWKIGDEQQAKKFFSELVTTPTPEVVKNWPGHSSAAAARKFIGLCMLNGVSPRWRSFIHAPAWDDLGK